MSYSSDNTTLGKGTSHRSPAYYNSCPVEVSFDAENSILMLDNTNGSNPMEYNIYDEDGNIVLTGFFNAYSCNNVSLGNLPEGTYHLEVDVAGYAYSGIINI